MEDEDFIVMMNKIDKRLLWQKTKTTKISNLVDTLYLVEKQKFKQTLAIAPRITTGLDIWTKRGLQFLFLQTVLVILTPRIMAHPHTAQSIVTLEDEWGILKKKKKILTIITDNGSNMVAAFHCSKEDSQDTSSSEEEIFQDSDEECQEVVEERSVSGCSCYLCTIYNALMLTFLP